MMVVTTTNININATEGGKQNVKWIDVFFGKSSCNLWTIADLLCQIWGSHTSNNKDYCLLICDAMLAARLLPKFSE
jgi:hypothetical protein